MSGFYFSETAYEDLLTNSSKESKYVAKINEHFKCDTPLESFIVYLIKVKINDSELEIKRRYSDFEWLINYLNNKYPYHILPPMPTKRYITGIGKFDRNFTEQRMKALEVMLNRLFQFEECLSDSRVLTFLKMEDVKIFIEYREQNKNDSILSQLNKMLKKLVKDTFVTLRSSTDIVLQQDEANIICLNILANRMTDRIITSCVIDHIDQLKGHWSRFQVTSLQMAQQLADIVMVMDTSETMKIIDCSAQFFFNWSSESRDHFRCTYEKILPVFLEYYSYNDRIVKKLRQRNKTKNALVIKTRQTESIRTSLTPEQVDSLPKANKLDTLMTESLTLQNSLTEFDSIFYPCYEKWLQQRSKDFAQCLNSFVYNQISYNRSLLEMARNCLDKMNEL